MYSSCDSCRYQFRLCRVDFWQRQISRCLINEPMKVGIFRRMPDDFLVRYVVQVDSLPSFSTTTLPYFLFSRFFFYSFNPDSQKSNANISLLHDINTVCQRSIKSTPLPVIWKGKLLVLEFFFGFIASPIFNILEVWTWSIYFRSRTSVDKLNPLRQKEG